MSTTTSTLPSRALVERDEPTTPTQPESLEPTGRPADGQSRKGIFDFLRVLVSGEAPFPGNDPLFLLGPNGGPVWMSRIQ